MTDASPTLRPSCWLPRPLHLASIVLVLAAYLSHGSPVWAQNDVEDVFGGFGTSSVADDDEAASKARAGEGSIAGTVYDGDTGLPVAGVTVIVTWPDTGDGNPPRQEVKVSDSAGAFEIPSIAPGFYDLSFVKSGYRASAMTRFEVRPDIVNQADFPLPPLPTTASGDVMQLDAFVVEASTVVDMVEALDLRMQSDLQLNIMTAEDLSKFAASDVADALTRVAGVNIVEGQFAIIRGLEDRYSSTVYNGAPIPSPDPTRQSVQLDLFPSEIVGNLQVAKTFGPALPGNSAGGNIDIITHAYPDVPFQVKVKGKFGLNTNVLQGPFLSYLPDSPAWVDFNGSGPYEVEGGAQIGGRFDVLERELRYQVLVNWEQDYGERIGYDQDLQPRRRYANPPYGDLTYGVLSLTEGRFDRTDSGSEEQLTAFGALGFDIDTDGNHKIDGSVFWTKKELEAVQLKENGYLPGYDYLVPNGPVERELLGQEVTFSAFDGSLGNIPGVNGALGAWIADTRDNTTSAPNRGPLWLSSFGSTKSVANDRELLLAQLNGDHTIGALEGLHFSWAANYAETSQSESGLGMKFWYEPCGYSTDIRMACPPGVSPIPVPTVFPVTVAAIGAGRYIGTNDDFFTNNDVNETQWFGRFDGDYERDLTGWLLGRFSAGFWYENAQRDIAANFLDNLALVLDPVCTRLLGLCTGSNSNPAIYADSPQELGYTVFNVAFLRDQETDLLLGTRESLSQANREIIAGYFDLKGTFWDDFDLLAGLRIESVDIESLNDPFQDGQFEQDRTDLIFPSKFLIFDRFGDNVSREGTRRDPPYNDQLLGIDLTQGPCRAPNPANGVPPPPGANVPGQCVDLVSRAEIQAAVNGKIDETLFLPRVGMTYRQTPELTVRASWSRTAARPSFRELGYYVSVEPDDDDLVIGNPLLDLSLVDSLDVRAEWVFGDLGDLAALTGFYKVIDDPVESIFIRNPVDQRASTDALFRTWFNNPNTAELWGIEFEASKNLGVFGLDFMQYFTLSGNATYISAEVARTEAELQRSEVFFAEGQTLPRTRRLFGQPEWITNVDLTFDQPDWGTSLTLAVFAISDVLDTAGSVYIGGDNTIKAYTPDRYVGSFYTLDLIYNQRLWEGLFFRFAAKNLTNSTRSRIYDPDLLSRRYVQYEYTVGRDFTFQLSFTFP